MCSERNIALCKAHSGIDCLNCLNFPEGMFSPVDGCQMKTQRTEEGAGRQTEDEKAGFKNRIGVIMRHDVLVEVECDVLVLWIYSLVRCPP